MDKSELLWKQLREDGNYTKSYSEFLKQFSTPEKINALYSVLKSDGHYTKSAEDFQNQFFSSAQMNQPTENFNTIDIPDNRKTDTITGLPVDDKGRMSAKIDSRYAKDIITKAKRHGVDPYTALAMNLQETGFKDEYSDNPFSVLLQNPEELDKFQKDPIDYSMQMLSDKHEYAKRLGKSADDEVIQSWNGYGKIHSQYGDNKFYGIDVSKEPLDMNKNPVYGKRIVDLRDNVIKQNPDIVSMVNEPEK